MKQKLSKKEKEYCNSVSLKVVKHFGWKITRHDSLDTTLWVKLPLPSEDKNNTSIYHGRVPNFSTEIQFYGDELNAHSWALVVKLINYFGGNQCPTEIVDAVKYLEKLVDDAKPIAKSMKPKYIKANTILD